MKRLTTLALVIFSFGAFGMDPIFLPEDIRLERNREFERLAIEGVEFASGSDIIGNGSGAAEQNLVFILNKLDRYLVLCLNDFLCAGKPKQKDVLKKLLGLSLEKRNKQDAVLFMRSGDFEKVFGKTADMEHRLAKTGFSPKFPIFVNVSELYKGKHQGDLGFLLSLLVHELGHQAGIASHAYLDSLAASVRAVFGRYYRSYRFEENGLSVELAHFSSPYFDYGLLSVGEQKFSFSAGLPRDVCPSGYQASALDWSNIYFKRPRGSERHMNIGIRAWGRAVCSDPKFVHNFSVPVDLKFDFVLKLSLDNQWELKIFNSEAIQ